GNASIIGLETPPRRVATEVKNSMAHSSISKLAQQTIPSKPTDSQAQDKVSPSRFDEVRSRLEKQAVGPEQPDLQGAAQISPQEKKRASAEYQRRLEEVRQRDLEEIFRTDM